MRSTARHCAIALVVLALAAAAWPGTPAPQPVSKPAPGGAWIGVVRDGVTTLQRGLGTALARRLARCRSTTPIFAGDRLFVAPDCAIRRTPLPAKARLALGLPLNVNTASSAELQVVAGIGPALARRIIARRPYARLEDLEKVRGIGPVRRARLTSSLTPAPPPLLWPSSTPPDASTPRTP